MFRTYYFFVGTYLSFVSASVYPTQPVQATVWSADQPMLVSWVDDWKYPVLSEMGLLDISLWCNTDTYLVQLASGVDPTTKTRRVTVPGWALGQSKYTFRFATTRPVDVVIYSADFAIIPVNTTMDPGTASMGSGAVALATPGGSNTATGTGTLAGSGFKTVPTATDVFSTGTTIATTSTTSTTTSDRFGSTTPSGVPLPSRTPIGGGGSEGQRTANAGRRGVDVEKLKFRFVFVIWPVLMGITMAL